MNACQWCGDRLPKVPEPIAPSARWAQLPAQVHHRRSVLMRRLVAQLARHRDGRCAPAVRHQRAVTGRRRGARP